MLETTSEGKRPEYIMQSLEGCGTVVLFGYDNRQRQNV